jgi:hypothetical protein
MDLIYQYQSGFIKGHDTQKQLAHIVDMIHQKWNDKMDVRGIFLDIERAFDSIPHFLLIRNLRSYGFGPNLISLMESYLLGRKLRVKVNHSYSDWSTIGDINS